MNPEAQKNVRAIERLVEIMNEGITMESIPRLVELASPDIVWHGAAVTADAPGGGVDYGGHAGWSRFWEDVKEVWADLHVQTVGIEPFGDSHVLALSSISGTGHGSGARITDGFRLRVRVQRRPHLRGPELPIPCRGRGQDQGAGRGGG